MSSTPNLDELNAAAPTDPTQTSPRFPILANLGKLLLQYGPILLQWLVTSGILKLPPGVTLPTLPTSGAAALEPSVVQALHATEVEVNGDELYRRLAALASLAAEAGPHAARA